ncbi:radical SAM protein [Fusobacterium sp. PH5-44]|uniref:radical SAM protein n=1 Tax=unclassified Fusobacterium TaxID=2648384 RepID=UPI003D1A6FF3
MQNEKTYKFISSTESFCPECQKLVHSKFIEEDNKVYLLKYCNIHGITRVLYEEDALYHKRKDIYDKNSSISKIETTIDRGCPYDCGLCPTHDQHTCIALIEITEKCNLNCNVCYANSGEGQHLSLNKIKKMIDFYQEAEYNKAEILQISGGEPTLHPNIIEIIAYAKTAGIPFVMLNTNGIKLAENGAFLEELSQFNQQGFEIYLQFDGLDNFIYQKLRGKNLLETKLKAIDNLIKYDIPITLVTTVAQGINDEKLGEILTFAMDKNCIRGINFQPVGHFGRLNSYNPDDFITTSGILKRIESQTNNLIQMDDFIPLPCNVEKIAISYLMKHDGSFSPIFRGRNLEHYTSSIENTFLFTAENVLKHAKENIKVNNLFTCGCNCIDFFNNIKSFLPKGFLLKSQKEKKKYLDSSTFRISINTFVDMYNFDLKSMQKECVHVITPELKRIPFSAYNMIHRKKW